MLTLKVVKAVFDSLVKKKKAIKGNYVAISCFCLNLFLFNFLSLPLFCFFFFFFNVYLVTWCILSDTEIQLFDLWDVDFLDQYRKPK